MWRQNIYLLVLSEMGIILFTLFSTSISLAQTQSMESLHSDLNQAMRKENLKDLSMLLGRMSDAIARGDMEPEHEAKCAEILMHISQIMVEMTGPSDKVTNEKHQKNIDKLENEWNAWEEMEEH